MKTKTEKELEKLHLGCGKDIKEGYINLDYIKGKGVDVVHNLNNFPYPFENNRFDEIFMQDILEHLEDTSKVLKELHRISKNGAIIKVRVPHCKSAQAWGDITHKRAFSCDSFKWYDILYKHKGSQTLETETIKIKRNKIKIIFPRPFHYIGLAYIFNLNNFSRYLYERYFSGIFLPENIYFELEVVK